MSAAAVQQPDASTGHPRDTRYDISVEVEYHGLHRGRAIHTGLGRTVNLSSSGVLFESDEALPSGITVHLWIRWPVRLNDAVLLNLFIVGRTVRSQGNHTAVRFVRHEFRTRPVRQIEQRPLPRPAQS
ncbi:MAG TPA: PilZ domain-containing protein, partial [Bryobacteraceae bacterium]|nr:PilZ domain-containing protein [Bryobacteraceae bacterium]